MTSPSADRFRDLRLAEFVERLASGEPVPGGGSASAVAASLGAALVTMVANLSIGREKYAAHEATNQWAAARGAETADRLLALADEDSASYAGFAAAMKLPRETDAQKADRTGAMQRAAAVAAEVPLRIVEACVEIVRGTEALAGRSNRNASSDLGVAVLLAEAGAAGAAENVFVNLPSMGDEAAAGELRRRTELAMKTLAGLAAETRSALAAGTERAPLDAPGA